MTADTIVNAWPIFAGALAYVAWLIRLESKVMYLERETVASALRFNKEIADIKLAHAASKNEVWQKMDDVQKTMSEILQALSKIQGKLEGSGPHSTP